MSAAAARARDSWRAASAAISTFIVPALVVVGAVIVFPWLFTVWMSAFDWKIGTAAHFVGLDNYVKLATNTRFHEAVGHTLYFTALAVVVPLVLGTIAALIFHREFPFRGAAALDLHHADDGHAGRGGAGMDDDVPSAAGRAQLPAVARRVCRPRCGSIRRRWVIPSLVLVEIWHWTPLVMLIVLGGLAALPIEPYESARLDGASEWQLFRYITFPLVAPFIVVAAVIRTIDAIKAFDTIYVISQGGPGTASETINLYLYLQAFAFYNVGNASAVVVVFFAIILALAMLLLYVRQRTKWT